MIPILIIAAVIAAFWFGVNPRIRGLNRIPDTDIGVFTGAGMLALSGAPIVAAEAAAFYFTVKYLSGDGGLILGLLHLPLLGAWVGGAL